MTIRKKSTGKFLTKFSIEHKALSIKQARKFFDDNLLLILTSLLLVFIPLYPKLPLFDLIPGYLVRVRLEDFFVLITAIFWLIQLKRGRAKIHPNLSYLVALYALAGLLAIFSGLVITKTIPFESIHLGKSLLHYLRYLEYFSLMFISFSAIKSKRHVYLLVSILFFTVLLISIYGYGQKFYYWPVYSTMNREFSKGIRLYLTEHARVQSTFGGHYDMAAFLVITLPLILSAFLAYSRKLLKLATLLVFLFGSWLLIVSASRTSFVAFLIAISLVVLFHSLLQQKWLDRIRFFITRETIFMILILVMLLQFGNDMSERLLQTLQSYPELVSTYHELNRQRKDFVKYQLKPKLSGLPWVSMPKPQQPDNAISTDELAKILVNSDTRPVAKTTNDDTAASNKKLPADVYENIPDVVYQEIEEEDGTTSVVRTQKDRTFSPNAYKFGLSLAIRLDTLWPQALKGFLRDPLFGSGYATLNKNGFQHFTEAESTDNNFLRTLGETGLFGFITFYGLVAMSITIAFRVIWRSKDKLNLAFAIGFLASSVGLLFNALYIDVFAASKVAFVYWLITGVFMAVVSPETLRLPLQSKVIITWRKLVKKFYGAHK